MRRSRAIALLFATLLASACSRFTIRSGYDRSANFSHLTTYGWLPLDQAAPADQRLLDRYIDNRLRAAVDRELGAKGYRPAGSAAPDFLLNYRLATEPASGVKGDPTRYFYGAGWYGWPGIESLYTESYDEGTLYIAVLDGASKHMIWLGAADARLLPTISLERRVRRVDAAVDQILAKFPPR
jgi:uncharacterized protein DUF4136